MDSYFNIFIIIIIYLLAELTKKIMVKTKKEEYRDLIPHICLIIGGLIAIILLYTYPKALSEAIDDPIQAFICGALSGVGATGSNQLFARTVKFKNTISSSFEFSEYTEETVDYSVKEDETTSESNEDMS